MISADDASLTVLNNWLAERSPLNIRLTANSAGSMSVVFEGRGHLQGFDDGGMDFGMGFWQLTFTFEAEESVISAPVPAANRPGSVAVMITSGPVICAVTGKPVSFGPGPV
ncbi:MAG: hypothetical protein ABSE56_22350 [Bryobacteraceae bacterium]|jgi:hypothetical protein